MSKTDRNLGNPPSPIKPNQNWIPLTLNHIFQRTNLLHLVLNKETNEEIILTIDFCWNDFNHIQFNTAKNLWFYDLFTTHQTYLFENWSKRNIVSITKHTYFETTLSIWTNLILYFKHIFVKTYYFLVFKFFLRLFLVLLIGWYLGFSEKCEYLHLRGT